MTPVGFIVIDTKAAYEDMECGPATDDCEPLSLKSSSVKQIQNPSPHELIRGMIGEAPIGALVWKVPPSSRSLSGTVDRHCLICGGIHTASPHVVLWKAQRVPDDIPLPQGVQERVSYATSVPGPGFLPTYPLLRRQAILLVLDHL